ncbi:MAG TPA: LCP family protein [Solirubrobacteraceae bacterium]|nr:LCP family protein [Solirubrobacteraceae bacterium]
MSLLRRNRLPAEERPPHHGRNMLLRFALGAIVIFALTAASVSSAVLLEVDDAVQIFTRESKPLDPGVKDLLADVEPGKPQTILIIGDDRRWADTHDSAGKLLKRPAPTRSDTMILVHLDPSRGATAIMSLPRDLRVDIPGYGRQKLNAAFAYGEDELALKTIRGLLGVPIHHYVRVTFWGFRGIVDRVGCVYTDVDRWYFNDNRPPAGGGDPYATINVRAGYQKLCGQKALDYVRFRHLDSDLVRETRQQQFLSDARSQVGVGTLFSDRRELLRIFGRSVRTDIRSSRAVLGLLKLVAESSSQPLQPIHITVSDATDGSGDVEATPSAIAAAVRRFLAVRSSTQPKGTEKRTRPSARKRRRSRSSSAIPSGLTVNKQAGEDLGARLSVKLGSRLPVYYPKLMATAGNYKLDDSRSYKLRDRSGDRHRAYRIVAYEGSIGQYYGVQGTDWSSPPILDDPSETRRVGRRTFQLYYDGKRLRLVGWKTSRGSYWVSNTLLRSLSERQMLALAQSLTRVGS